MYEVFIVFIGIWTVRIAVYIYNVTQDIKYKHFKIGTFQTNEEFL